jgi:uncharacterized protein YxeA
MKKIMICSLAVLVFVGLAAQTWADIQLIDRTMMPASYFNKIKVTVKAVSSTGTPYAGKIIYVYDQAVRRILTMVTDRNGEAQTYTPLPIGTYFFDFIISRSPNQGRFFVFSMVSYNRETGAFLATNPEIWEGMIRNNAPGWSARVAVEEGNKLVLTVTEPRPTLSPVTPSIPIGR